MFQDLNFSSSQKDLKQSYYSSFFKDSSYNANENFLLKSKTKEVLTPLMFLKCPKHPMFDLILVCTEKKCNYSPVICKVCLTDTHLDHKYMNLTDFFHVTKEKIKKNEYIKEQKFLKIKSNIDQIIENLCLEYGEIIKTMKDFIENVQAKMKTDFNFFWKSLQEYPPFKFSTIIRRIENNSINTVRVLNSSLNFLLDYDNEKKAKINQELETEIEENFTSILQNMKYNQEKLKKTKEKVEEVLNSILLDKISTFHSNYAPKNDSMVLFFLF